MNIKRIKLLVLGMVLLVVGGVATYVGVEEYKENKRVEALEAYWKEREANEPKGKYEFTKEEVEEARREREIELALVEEGQNKKYNDLSFNSLVKEIRETYDLDINLIDEEIEDLGLTIKEEGWDTTGIFQHWNGAIYVENKEGKEEVLLHELGHAMDYNGSNEQGVIYQYSDSKEFKSLFVSEVVDYFKDDDYALTSRQEAFSDLVSEVVFNPIGLREEAPNTYNYVRPLVEEIISLRPLLPKTF